ncbi:MAG: chromosome segregation protein SMC [Planctomycetota bacterium]|jgi:chromosome segregation protein
MKLKKLILTGFKSFAKKTEFEFDDGVSCVVGPNGCGKSNIVDAVKWVLGERSAKSLRGEEMADVIFNGSAARCAAGMAEVKLLFDDVGGLLKPDLHAGESSNGEVSIGRRLYRSGQSEYLINNTVCRLKDIREMFMDTGVGVEAYSLIEQGKVEIFLQASQDERRSVLDEAAGISKYKARKRETLRKLERVEQNLLRVSDVLAEVEKRLRSIKYQAGKARSYQAHTQRLKELRSLYFLAQYHMLSRQRAELQGRVDEGNDSLAGVAATIDKLESSGSAAEIETIDLERAARQLEGKIATIGGQITTCEGRVDMLTARAKELGERIVVVSAKCEELEAEIAKHDSEIEARNGELAEVLNRSAKLSEQHEDADREHDACQQAIAELQGRLDDAKAEAIDFMRQASNVRNEINALNIRRENLEAQGQRLEQRASQIAASLRSTADQKAEAEAKLSGTRHEIAAAERRLGKAKEAERRLTETEREIGKDIARCRESRSAVRSRTRALGEMLTKLEGVGCGTRRIVEACRAGRLKTVRGMLADFIDVEFKNAPVVEAALAGSDELLIAEDLASQAEVAEELKEVLGGGSAEVLCPRDLEVLKYDFDASRCRRVIGRVIDYVSFPVGLAPVVWRLLGRTFVTESLSEALLAAGILRGCRFVTRTGEVLEADGRMKLNCAGRSTGLVARKSELAELARQEQSLAAEITRLQRQQAATTTKIGRVQAFEQRLRTSIYETSTQQVECEGAIKRLDGLLADLTGERQVVAAELKAVVEETDAAERQQAQASVKAEEMEQQKSQCDERVTQLADELAAAGRRQQSLAARITELQVAQAAAEEKKVALREAAASLARQKQQKQRDIETGRGEISLNRRRREEAQLGAEHARQEIERLYAEQQRLEKEAEEAEESRKGLQERLEEIRRQLSERRKAQQQLAEQVNARRVELGEVDVRIENLLGRAGDEMGMDLLELYKTYEHDEDRDWDAVKAEIQELNEKVSRLGNVNLDAISEQDELEQRREFLSKQSEDIKSSRNQLAELIRRINKESCHRFLETFEAARKNFQELFRKLFGGGRADIMLLDPDNVLESGIEIVARPPGKELRSLSLLSGGEKTMTALALLFSIFKIRPSPFCLLDEVDAALDEPNTERFGQLVREFVSASQFIIISHAKRTMSMANVLYGVTMQEAGVSTRISVRFEDVGHKLDEQLEPVGA